MSKSINLSKYNKDTKILNLSNQNIKGVLNLFEFHLLEELYCSNNQITEIIGLRYNVKILDCSNNNIVNCNFLLYHMMYLNCANNNIKYLYYPMNIKPKKYSRKIKKIHYGSEYNKPLINLPSNLESLKLGHYFNYPVANLPDTVSNLTLGPNTIKVYNYPLSLIMLTIETKNETKNETNININLPTTIIQLVLGYYFNQSLDYLPNSIESIVFSEDADEYKLSNFNHNVDNLPNSIEYIRFGNKFNQSINNLPDSIVNINFSDNSYFNREINKLPLMLEYLCFEMEYESKINLYENVNNNVTLELYEEYRDIDKLPNCITHLVLNFLPGPLYNLSRSVNHLTLYMDRWKYLATIPENVKILSLGYIFKGKLHDKQYEYLLDSLEKIYICNDNQYELLDDKYHHKVFIKY